MHKKHLLLLSMLKTAVLINVYGNSDTFSKSFC